MKESEKDRVPPKTGEKDEKRRERKREAEGTWANLVKVRKNALINR